MAHEADFRLCLPKNLLERMRAEKERTGSSMAEILRRAVDEYLEKREEKNASRS